MVVKPVPHVLCKYVSYLTIRAVRRQPLMRDRVVLLPLLKKEELGISEGFRAKNPKSHSEERQNHAAFSDQEAVALTCVHRSLTFCICCL